MECLWTGSLELFIGARSFGTRDIGTVTVDIEMVTVDIEMVTVDIEMVIGMIIGRGTGGARRPS